MHSPQNYSEWCSVFDEIAKAPIDEKYIEIVTNGCISWSSGVAERFLRNAVEMIRTRINKAQDAFQRQVRNSRGETRNLVYSLKTLRKEYCYSYELAAALPIPEEYSIQIRKLVQDQADQTQKSLEESAQEDRTGHLKLIVKNAGVNKLVSNE